MSPIRRGHVAGFVQEVIMLLGQQPLDLALGDRQADRLQQSGPKTRQCRLALMVLHQHEAAQSQAPKCPSVPSCSGAMIIRPSDVSQRSRR